MIPVFNRRYDIPNDKVVLMELEQDTTAEHGHNYLEFVYITKGEGWHRLNGKNMKICAGDYFMLDYNAVHSYKRIANKPLHLINCLFLPEFIDPALNACKSFETLMNNHLIHFSRNILKTSPVNNIFKDNDGSVFRRFSVLLEEYKHKPYGYLERIRCNLIEILILMLRDLAKSQSEIQNDAVIFKIIKDMEQNYKEASLQSTALRLNYSVPYLSMRFKKATGATFTEYLQKIRIEKCCDLLLNTKLSIEEIAAQIGYSDLKYFHAVFKKHMAQSPGSFRKNSR